MIHFIKKMFFTYMVAILDMIGKHRSCDLCSQCVHGLKTDMFDFVVTALAKWLF